MSKAMIIIMTWTTEDLAHSGMWTEESRDSVIFRQRKCFVLVCLLGFLLLLLLFFCFVGFFVVYLFFVVVVLVVFCCCFFVFWVCLFFCWIMFCLSCSSLLTSTTPTTNVIRLLGQCLSQV